MDRLPRPTFLGRGDGRSRRWTSSARVLAGLGRVTAVGWSCAKAVAFLDAVDDQGKGRPAGTQISF